MLKYKGKRGKNMKDSIYILKEQNNFEPKHIFECGQCFRWNKELDGTYTGIVGQNVINVKKIESDIIFTSTCKQEELKQIIDLYFDLKTDYGNIVKKLEKVDKYLKESIKFGNGIRILNQDLWEVIISFIISANNNIPRIKGIIERIAKQYGKEIKWNEKSYYSFPTIEELAKASIEDLRKLGLGFRDKRVYETTQILLSGQIDLENLNKNQNTEKVKEILLTLPGVGPKVADCILLFGMHRFEVFPIDVWVRRVMNELYLKNEDESKVDKKQIEELAKIKYSNLAGIAQQYLFYWKRETA